MPYNSAPRLRAYVRRTILDSAKEGAWPKKRRTKESTRAALLDAMRGTDTGWWVDLIYTKDILAMANRYRHQARSVIREIIYETEADPNALIGGTDHSYNGIIAATYRLYSWEDIDDPEFDAAQLGVRIAIEYLAEEMAREYCPDL